MTSESAVAPANKPLSEANAVPEVLRFGGADRALINQVLGDYGLRLRELPADAEIPGSYWGTPEAGLIGQQLLVRPDTPVHSLLHEACHFICMDKDRRARLHTDAGGTVAEENAVCMLQILIGEQLLDLPRARLFADMDAWGYSFRLGSAQAWFEQDAEDARDWLREAGLIERDGRVLVRDLGRSTPEPGHP
ncbi:hypothetical protein Thiowin_00816 [Thiorhodovibrio winogradskyi]|uniref:IrrE N-terminal-like domain-containing protein n=1 Tax=Thiorhodovibrio winogradskyi TaxID=77007 RepID=A0ABZ0S497_9GAMM|nr:hypothetical protein [Thiorhodovibrio winogradskyi]